jgi:hypothetical protein
MRVKNPEISFLITVIVSELKTLDELMLLKKNKETRAKECNCEEFMMAFI